MEWLRKTSMLKRVVDHSPLRKHPVSTLKYNRAFYNSHKLHLFVVY